MAQLNIYKDCSSTKPSKTYECRRLLFGVTQKALSLAEAMQGKSDADQFKMLGEIIQVIFPDITDADIACMDIAEMKDFVAEVFSMSVNELKNAQKN